MDMKQDSERSGEPCRFVLIPLVEGIGTSIHEPDLSLKMLKEILIQLVSSLCFRHSRDPPPGLSTRAGPTA